MPAPNCTAACTSMPYRIKGGLHIHRRLHALIEPVGKVGGGDGQNQLLDLLNVVKLAERLEVGRLNRRGPGGELFRELDRRALFLSEDIAARTAGFLQGLNLLVRNASPLRRSGVSTASIQTPIHERGAEIGQFLDLWVQHSGSPNLLVELQKWP